VKKTKLLVTLQENYQIMTNFMTKKYV